MAITRLGPNQDITAAKIAGQITFKNIIINGDMSVAQRGTSSTSAGYATVDRIHIARDATSLTQSQESLSSSDSPYSLGFRKYFRLTNTGTSSATDTYVAITQRIEAQNIATSGWNYTSSSSSITISFWVRSSLAGTYYCTPRTEDGTSYNYAFPIVLSANTWTKITKTITGNSNLTIDNDNGNGFSLRIWTHLGSDYTTSGYTTNQWNVYSSTDQAPDYSQNWRNTASATFDITGVQLEVDTSASDFEFLPLDVNLRRCQRYYEILGYDGGSGNALAVGQKRSTSSAQGSWVFRVDKRTNPTLSLIGDVTDLRLHDPNGGNLTGSSISGNGTPGKTAVWIGLNTSNAGLDNTPCVIYMLNNNGGAGYTADAEL